MELYRCYLEKSGSTYGLGYHWVRLGQAGQIGLVQHRSLIFVSNQYSVLHHMAVQMDTNSVGVMPITPIPCRCDTGSLVGRSEAGHSQFRNIFYWKRNLNQKFKTSKIIKLSTKPTWFPGGCWEKQRLTGGRITSSGLMDATLTPHSHCRCHICAKAVYNLRCHMNLAKNRAESGIARFQRLLEKSWDFRNIPETLKNSILGTSMEMWGKYPVSPLGEMSGTGVFGWVFVVS